MAESSSATTMKALLALISKQAILEWVVTKFLGLVPGVWSKARELVLAAETRFPATGSGADKKAWVMAELSAFAGGMKQHLLDAVVGIAVQELKTQLAK